VNGVDAVWGVGRLTIGSAVRILAPLRSYGSERMPQFGGVVLAMNHFHWLDPAAFGAACPRTIYYMAKIEAHRAPGLGQLIRAFGTFAVRRGESDREAVRRMREVVRDGKVLGIFAEGTRQLTGVPGTVQPGAAMAALQEDVPVVCAAIHGSQTWKLGSFAPVSIAWGEPMRFDGLPRGGKGYREASVEIERELHRLWGWLADLHGAGGPRPRHAVPPRATAGLRAPVTLL
jgi:1-acyl-sn-glycerol-3-phosphate acyltransferase